MAIVVGIVVVIGGVVLLATQLGGDDDDDDDDGEMTSSTDETVEPDDEDANADEEREDNSDGDAADIEAADEDVQEYADAISPVLSQFGTVDDDAAECIGVGFVDGIGVDRLESDGITPDDFGTGNPDDGQFLTVSDGELFVSTLKDCGVEPRDYFLEGFVQGSDARAECLDEALGDDDIDVVLAHAIPNEQPSSDLMEVLTSECPTDM